MSKDDNLFSDFPPTSTQDWEARLLKELKGKDYEETLVWDTGEGFKLRPYYRSEDTEKDETLPGHVPYRRGMRSVHNDWEIRQDVLVNTPEQANNHALAALMKGISAVGFVVDENAFSKEDMHALLEDILIEHISVNFRAGKHAPGILNHFIKEALSRKLKGHAIRGSVDYNPLSHLTLQGKWYQNQEADFEQAAEMIQITGEHLPLFRCIQVNGADFHNSGASIVQELACSLAQGNEYLAQFTERGLKMDDITARVQFSFATGSEYFPQIAKIKAFRMLWAKIVEQYQPEHECSHATFIHSTSSEFTMAAKDPHVNMLRATTQTMSAVLGGCDSFTVIPYDAVYKAPGNFSERVARNVQLILKEEAYFNKIADPAAGSYYIDQLMDKLGEQAWSFFQKIEGEGGYIAALKSGFIQDSIEKTASEKRKAFAEKETVMVGVNKYASASLSTSTPSDEKTSFPAMEKTPSPEISEQTIAPLQSFRLADVMEK